MIYIILYYIILYYAICSYGSAHVFVVVQKTKKAIFGTVIMAFVYSVILTQMSSTVLLSTLETQRC